MSSVASSVSAWSAPTTTIRRATSSATPGCSIVADQIPLRAVLPGTRVNWLLPSCAYAHAVGFVTRRNLSRDRCTPVDTPRRPGSPVRLHPHDDRPGRRGRAASPETFGFFVTHHGTDGYCPGQPDGQSPVGRGGRRRGPQLGEVPGGF